MFAFAAAAVDADVVDVVVVVAPAPIPVVFAAKEPVLLVAGCCDWSGSCCRWRRGRPVGMVMAHALPPWFRRWLVVLVLLVLLLVVLIVLMLLALLVPLGLVPLGACAAGGLCRWGLLLPLSHGGWGFCCRSLSAAGGFCCCLWCGTGVGMLMLPGFL